MTVMILCRIHRLDTLMKGCQDFGDLKGGHVKKSTPDLRAGEAANCELCDDAEII